MRKVYLLIIVLLTCFAGISSAQNRVINGTVTEKGNGSTLPGVSVMVKDGKLGTQTTIDGKYQLNVPASGTITLVFKYIGYKTIESVVPANFTLNVQLETSTNNLDEVVVIGYATVKRKELTGSTSSVSGDELKFAPVTTAAQALMGKAAGVSVITQSGAPGAASNVVIRGGTTITQGSTPLYIVDGFQMEDALSQIDINDIENIDILKDASATSIYGARGANGVILITTKSGKAGKTLVNYNGYYGLERLGKELPVLNVLDYTKYQYELQTLAGTQANWATYFGGDVTSPTFFTGAAARIQSDYGSRSGIDWQKSVFGSTAPSMNHNVSMTSGTDKTKFFLSYNNTQEDGLLSKHDFLRNTIRMKINHEVFKNLHVDFNSSFQSTRIDGGGSLNGALKMTTLQPPTGGVLYTDNQLLNTDVSADMKVFSSQSDLYNPFINNNAVAQSAFTRQFTAGGGATLGITKDITFHILGNYLWKQIRNDYFDDGSTQTAINNLGPYGSIGNAENFTWQITNTLNWSHSFKKHTLGLLVGQEANYSQSIGLNNNYYQFPVDNFGLNNVGLTNGIAKNTSASDVSRNSLASFFGRASYNYKDKYIANFTLRADGSSKFGPNNRWGYFPSASAAWRISEENFMKDQDIVSNLKLRVGYGTAGNDNIADYIYVTSYGAGTYAINNANFNTLVPGSVVGNPTIKWEKSASTNIGLDMEFLKGRIALSVDAYSNKSTNLLIKNSIPPSAGYTSQFQNIGAISNRGLEIMVTSTNINSKSLRWKTNYNMAFNKSKVLKIYGIGDNDFFLSNYGSRLDFKVQVGQPLGQFFGYQYGGVYTTDDFTQNANGTYTVKNGVPRSKAVSVATLKPGDIKYVTTAGAVDANGNPTWSTDDRTVIGNAEPKFTGGITNTFNYKGLDLIVFMNFSVGGQIFDMNSQRFIGPYLPNQNTLTVMNNRFTLIDPATGKETTNLATLAQLNPQQFSPNAIWSLHSTNSIGISDALNYYLEDASYLRINTVTIGYTLPRAWTSKISLKNTRLYCTLHNLYTFTKYKGYDPEVAANSSILNRGVDDSAFPRSRSVVFGVNVSF